MFLLEGRPSPGEFSGGIEGENKMLFCEEIPTEREKNGAAWGGCGGKWQQKRTRSDLLRALLRVIIWETSCAS